MEEGKYQVIADMSFILGAGVIICVASLLLISSLLFAAGYPLNRFCFSAALTVTAAALWYLCRHCFESKKMFYFATLLLLLAIIFLACIYAAGCLYDLSWDGQAYHQEAVIQLRNGWNPFHDAPLKGIHSVWINHYAKFQSLRHQYPETGKPLLPPGRPQCHRHHDGQLPRKFPGHEQV